MLAVKRRFLHLSVSGKLVLILWLFVTIMIGLLALNYEAIQSLSAARAYVGGEGLWSKAQKQAVLDLMRYSRSHAEEDYRSYERALQTPLGDKIARLELEKQSPDLDKVSAGFIQGRNSPEDVRGMAKLFRRFRHTRYMAEAVDIWTEADFQIERLKVLGDQLHVEIRTREPNLTKIAEITTQIEAVGNQLAPLEDRFSYALGRGARWTAGLFLLVTFSASAMCLGIGISLTVLMLRHLRETGEKYKRLIDTANDAILVMDAANGLILEANERSSSLLGLNMRQILGKSGAQIFSGADREKFHQVLSSTLRGERVTSQELNVIHSDGHVVPIEVNTSLTELEGRKIIQGIFRDITERKRMEEKVLQAQKMEVVGRLAGCIAHDFNNLLMVIRTHTSKIISHSKHARVPEYAETIQIAADKAASLTKQLLAFGRKQVLLVEVVDLNELVKEVHPLLSTLPAQEVQLVVIPSAETLPVKVDPGKIQQVVMNLAVNARDAMPRGGLLQIKMSRQTRNDSHDPYALLAVTDTGCGMDTETISHIFEPFFTTKPSGKGTGLGLSTVYGIVKQSGGVIEVDSVPDGGSVFRIYFPLVQEPIKQRKLRTTVSSVLEGSETVLLAEDQSEIRIVLREFLESKGYKVLEAESGSEALARAGQYSSPIDVLVTDVIMPQVGGIDLAREIRRLHPTMRIILMSGYSEEVLVEIGLLSDENVVLIQKPFDPEDLVRKVRESLSARGYGSG